MRDRVGYVDVGGDDDQLPTGRHVREATATRRQPTAGVADVAFAAGTPMGELPLGCIVEVIMSDADASAVVVTPKDSQATLVQKASGSGEYLGGGPFGRGSRTLWDLPSIPSKALTQGTALVGDRSQATVFVRQGANARISDAYQADFDTRVPQLMGTRAGV